jgi:hypothetical protein
MRKGAPGRYLDVHAAADALEVRLARALSRSMAKMRDRISITSLAHALARGDINGALSMLDEASVKDALSPAATIAREAFVRGGRVGAAKVNEARIK